MKKFSILNYQKAFLFANEAHKKQTVDGYPYIFHVVMVASEVIEAFFYEEFSQNEIDISISSALLHDTIEDTEITYDDIFINFGKEIADGVLALTKNIKLAKSYQMVDSLERISKQPKNIQIVKLADRITNLHKPPSYWDREKKIKYQQEAKVIYDYLHNSSDFLANKLENRIKEYTKYIEETAKNFI